MSELPQRKPIRLTQYDYSQNGCYFVTICVKDRHEMLGRVVYGGDGPYSYLSNDGKIVRNDIDVLSMHYTNVFIDKYIIMPNHIHMIIRLVGAPLAAPAIENIMIADKAGRASAPPTIGTIIRCFKSGVSRKLGFSLWQRSYHDRIIRSEKEYQCIWRYIDENPAHWADDEYYPIK